MAPEKTNRHRPIAMFENRRLSHDVNGANELLCMYSLMLLARVLVFLLEI